jgi:copper chaperone NosL
MRKKLIQFIGFAGMILLLAACGEAEVQPVEINESTDTCDVCNMMVANDQHATQVVLANGKSMVFDDIGCMYDWIGSNANEEIAGNFVRDYHDKEWVLVDEATFVYNPSVKTPMAYNVVSFKDKTSAEDFAGENEGSTIMSASELAEHSWERNKDMMKKNKMENHSHSGDMKENHSDESENNTDGDKDDESHQ